MQRHLRKLGNKLLRLTFTTICQWNQQTGNTSAILDLGLVNVARGQSVRRTSIGLSAPENMVIASVIL